jgi:protein-tyrosine phosphatase
VAHSGVYSSHWLLKWSEMDDEGDENVDCVSGRLIPPLTGEDVVRESCLDGIQQVTDKVFLSGIRPFANPEVLVQLGIGLILCCATPEVKIALAHIRVLEEFPSIKLMTIPYEDASSQSLATSTKDLPPILTFRMRRVVKSKLATNLLDLSHQVISDFDGKVLVHCYAGVSRSVSVVCYHLMKSRKIPFLDALAHVQSIRPIADPNNGFREQLTRWEGLIRLFEAIKPKSIEEEEEDEEEEE